MRGLWRRRRERENGGENRGETRWGRRNFTKMRRKNLSCYLVVRIVLWSDAVDLLTRGNPSAAPLHLAVMPLSRFLSFSLPHDAFPISSRLSSFISSPPFLALRRHIRRLWRRIRRVAGISDTLRRNRKCHGNAITGRKKQIYGYVEGQMTETKGEKIQ